MKSKTINSDFLTTNVEPMVKDFALHSKSTQVRETATVTNEASYHSYSVIEKNNDNLDAHIDYSTTLVKDIHAHFDPVELILQNKTLSSSSTYIRDDSPHRRHVNKYDAINLIIPKPSFRSESMPPVAKTQIRTVQETPDTDDEIFYYYTDRSVHANKLITPLSNNKVTYYKEIERKHSHLQPIELIIDATSLQSKNVSSKRVREMSLPTTTKHIRQANIYLTDYRE
jgi:hypothetical protein